MNLMRKISATPSHTTAAKVTTVGLVARWLWHLSRLQRSTVGTTWESLDSVPRCFLTQVLQNREHSAVQQVDFSGENLLPHMLCEIISMSIIRDTIKKLIIFALLPVELVWLFFLNE